MTRILTNGTFWVFMLFFGFPLIALALIYLFPQYEKIFGIIVLVSFGIIGLLWLVNLFIEVFNVKEHSNRIWWAVIGAILVIALLWFGGVFHNSTDYEDQPKCWAPGVCE